MTSIFCQGMLPRSTTLSTSRTMPTLPGKFGRWSLRSSTLSALTSPDLSPFTSWEGTPRLEMLMFSNTLWPRQVCLVVCNDWLKLLCSVSHWDLPPGVRPRLDSAVSPGQRRPLPQPPLAGAEPHPGHHLDVQPQVLLHLPGQWDHPRGLQAGRGSVPEEGEQGAGGAHQVLRQEVHESGPALRAPRPCLSEAGPEAAVIIVMKYLLLTLSWLHTGCALFCLILIHYVLQLNCWAPR